jgi:hypothetical protein
MGIDRDIFWVTEEPWGIVLQQLIIVDKIPLSRIIPRYIYHKPLFT